MAIRKQGSTISTATVNKESIEVGGRVRLAEKRCRSKDEILVSKSDVFEDGI